VDFNASKNETSGIFTTLSNLYFRLNPKAPEFVVVFGIEAAMETDDKKCYAFSFWGSCSALRMLGLFEKALNGNFLAFGALNFLVLLIMF
jgi:hypothetical protein